MSRGETTVLAGLLVGVEAIGAPVLIVGAGGEVMHANASGRSLLERDAHGVSRSLTSALAGEPNEGCVLIPLVGQDGSAQYLAIFESAAPVVSVQVASARWKLTARQAQVLDLVAHGMTNATIAAILEIGVTTVEFHVSRIFDKAGVENRTSLIAQLHSPSNGATNALGFSLVPRRDAKGYHGAASRSQTPRKGGLR